MTINGACAGDDQFPHGIDFVLVNDRVPREDADCALCGASIANGSYVREPRTHLFYCDMRCFAGHAIATKNRERRQRKVS